MNISNEVSTLEPTTDTSTAPDGFVQLCKYGDAWEYRLGDAAKKKLIRSHRAGPHARSPIYLHDADVKAYQEAHPLPKPPAPVIDIKPENKMAILKRAVAELLNELCLETQRKSPGLTWDEAMNVTWKAFKLAMQESDIQVITPPETPRLEAENAIIPFDISVQKSK